jgi:hypothetical protein
MKEKKCDYCNKIYKPNSQCKECGLKCRLLNGIKKNGDCWDWKRKISKTGYGQITINSKYCSVHRESYKFFKGEIPLGNQVCHSCDNKKCINPEHLWVGTQKENIQDAKNKNRLADQRGRKHSKETLEKLKLRPHSDRRGEKHHLRKLNEKDIFKIRDLLKNGYTQKQIGEMYEVNQSTICQIKNGKRWSHI